MNTTPISRDELRAWLVEQYTTALADKREASDRLSRAAERGNAGDSIIKHPSYQAAVQEAQAYGRADTCWMALRHYDLATSEMLQALADTHSPPLVSQTLEEQLEQLTDDADQPDD